MRKGPVAAATATGAQGLGNTGTLAEEPFESQSCGRPFAENAEALWSAGLTPIPLGGDDGKQPLIRGFTKWWRRPALSTVLKWAQRHPNANVGIVTGKLSGVTIVDIDDSSNIDEMIERFGETPLQTETPRGGRHLWYRFSGERSRNLRPSEDLPVEVKATGTILVVPPSIRPNGEFAGRRYELVEGTWDDLPNLPPLRIEAARSPCRDGGEPPVPLRAIQPGRRNNTLFRQLLRHAPHCDDFDALSDVARTIADQQFVVTRDAPLWRC
jgi:hypothetical protein